MDAWTEEILFQPIGVIRTPYTDDAPYQPVDGDSGDFRLELDPLYEQGLRGLETFRYIYVLYFLHRLEGDVELIVRPPWAQGVAVGVFASRSPNRPNPIGLSVVRVLRVEGNTVHVSGLDVYDGTPLLDIKPYVRELDSKADANYGWVEQFQDREHLILHVKGIPHKH